MGGAGKFGHTQCVLKWRYLWEREACDWRANMGARARVDIPTASLRGAPHGGTSARTACRNWRRARMCGYIHRV
eukprot:2162261-Pyramimonas_sp.AAC.1